MLHFLKYFHGTVSFPEQ